MRERQGKENKIRDHSAKRKKIMQAKLKAIKEKRLNDAKNDDMNKLYAKTMVKTIDSLLQKEQQYKLLFN